MTRKLKTWAVFGSVLISSFLILSLTGCGTTQEMLSWIPFCGPKQPCPSLWDKKIEGNPDSHYQLGRYYQDRGKHEGAIKEFEKVLSISPGYVEAYNALGISCDMIGNFTMAVEAYKQALRLNPHHGQVYNNLGYSYILQGNIEEAITTFKKANALDGSDRRTHNNLGLAYGKKGNFEQALAEFKLAGTEAQAHYNLAQIYYEKGLFRDAAQNYALALNLDASFAKARLRLRAALALADITGQALLPAKSPAGTAEPSVLTAGEKDITLRNVKIEVSNGNGVNRMARRVGNHLKQRGLKVVRLTNANNFNHKKTKVYYQQGYFEAADHVATQIPGVQNLQETDENRQDIKVRVLIGKDLTAYDSKVFKREATVGG